MPTNCVTIQAHNLDQDQWRILKKLAALYFGSFLIKSYEDPPTGRHMAIRVILPAELSTHKKQKCGQFHEHLKRALDPAAPHVHAEFES